MLAHNNGSGINVQPNKETTICTWESDGLAYVIGFQATGQVSGDFKLYVEGDPYYYYQTSPSNRTAYTADRGSQFPAGTKVELKVKHYDSTARQFYGTILGGR